MPSNAVRIAGAHMGTCGASRSEAEDCEVDNCNGVRSEGTPAAEQEHDKGPGGAFTSAISTSRTRQSEFLGRRAINCAKLQCNTAGSGVLPCCRMFCFHMSCNGFTDSNTFQLQQLRCCLLSWLEHLHFCPPFEMASCSLNRLCSHWNA